ncbi:hypothetical protein G4Z16_04820 [Streptomyces bathyalis]|uniref:Uncharacterized protein n=1 Tax=Streptomyces bathyalis TaxID=2710756 RepID=A0A7T1WR92_9ACTN|nr:hypothetical protein [Streptomyces bathyalis]QPP05832.1 hypothetical protein G4Z16_04820 [Streptomyces bathyalis]
MTPTGSTDLRLTGLDPVAHPPLALYQSPWTVSLALAFASRGAGTYAIDDIDNAGVERGRESDPGFRVVRKEIMSKKGWTNCRPLSAFCPDGFLFPNLGRAGYGALDRTVPLSAVARHHSTTVQRLIRETSRTYGMWSLAGPDRAITAIGTDDAEPALREIISRHEEAVCRTLRREKDRKPALERLRHLMPDPRPGSSLLGYFQECLRRGLALVGSDSPVISAARDLLPPDGGSLLPRFVRRDPGVVAAYNSAAAVQGSRPLSDGHSLPYYTVGLRSGERTDLTGPLPHSAEHIIAPKILALEGVQRMALPRCTAHRGTVLARERAYRGLRSGSSQVFFESNWLQAMAGCSTPVNVHEIFRPLLGGHRVMPMSDLAGALERYEHSCASPDGQADEHRDPGEAFAHWALRETLHDLRTWQYPLLAFAVGGDDWLARLEITSYEEYEFAVT